MITMTTTGADELAELLTSLADPKFAASVARSAVSAGMKTLMKAAIKASPGKVKLEYGQRPTSDTSGIVGMGVGGYKSRVKRPHGMYLENGTPYIAARHFASSAFASAMPKARQRMISMARFRIDKATKKE